MLNLNRSLNVFTNSENQKTLEKEDNCYNQDNNFK